MSTLQLRSVAKRFAGISALEDMSLTLEPGEIFSLTGPSAAGKTTTCRLISGIERPSEGEILFDGDLWNRVPAKEREVAYMFESYALYPQLNVFDNVAFPLRAPQRRGRLNESEIARSVRAMLELVEMQALEQRLPAELSGGQKQRVALCRALVQEPSVYLLDEPISHLDAKLRHKLRGEIRRRQLSKTVPTLWATPDAMEAISVSDRIAVILDGRIRQIGSSREVYTHPASIAVARLIGDPAMNLLPGRLEEECGHLMFRHASFALAMPESLRQRVASKRQSNRVVLGVRPTAASLTAPTDADRLSEAKVYTVEPFGKYSVVTLQLGSDLFKIKAQQGPSLQVEDRVGFKLSGEDFTLFDADNGDVM